MRFAIALVALSAMSASASSLLTRRQSFPTCAVSCLSNADFGTCSSSDDQCLCSSPAFVSSVTNCITSSCTGSDVTQADSAAQALCLAVGITLTSTPSGTGTGSTPSSTVPSGASTSSTPSTASTSSGSSSSSHQSSSSSAPSPSKSANGAMTHGVNALAGLAAVGAIAFGL